jgi:hypothetical protein
MGVLNLSSSFVNKRYMELQDKLGVSIIGIHKEIPLEANLLLEIGSMVRKINGRTALSVSSDARCGTREAVVVNTTGSPDVP